MLSIVNELKLIIYFVRHCQNIVFMSFIYLIDMKGKPIPRHGELTCEVSTTSSHQPKKVAINSLFITVKVKIVIQLSFINSPTCFITKLIFRKEKIPKIDKIFFPIPSLLIMFTFSSHVMNRIHIVSFCNIVVHNMMCQVKG